jgi:aspartyl-tRNA(Asn)/glutamyl-tRNA(Gln) amidotransferase subunit A
VSASGLADLTAGELRECYRRGDAAPSDAVRAVFERIDALEPRLHAYLSLDREGALAEARRWDAAARAADAPPLAGIPVAIKDNICTRGWPTTCASRILAGFRPPYDATVVRRLRAAGAIVIGKANCDEFAMGSSTENSAYGPTRNPWDESRVPGGTSGGSTAAVAAGEAALALGSDTGGSIRQPAAFCGVVGMKPTYGRVSRYGLVAFASSLDQIGPIARCVADAALLLQVIAGWDPADSTSARVDVPPYAERLRGDLRGVRLGVVRECFAAGLDQGIARAVRQAIETCRELGAVCEEVSLPHAEYALPAYYVIAPAEASSNLARYAGVHYGRRAAGAADTDDVVALYCRTRREGFGAEVKRRIMLGTYALSTGYYEAFYLRALRVRTLVRRDFEAALGRYDALLSPVTPTAAFRLGEKIDDPLQMYLSDVYTVPLNLAGLPGISVPCGFAGGLPVGLQIVGRAFDEQRVLDVAYAFEQATPFHTVRPALAGARDAAAVRRGAG